MGKMVEDLQGAASFVAVLCILGFCAASLAKCFQKEPNEESPSEQKRTTPQKKKGDL